MDRDHMCTNPQVILLGSDLQTNLTCGGHVFRLPPQRTLISVYCMTDRFKLRACVHPCGHMCGQADSTPAWLPSRKPARPHAPCLLPTRPLGLLCATVPACVRDYLTVSARRERSTCHTRFVFLLTSEKTIPIQHVLANRLALLITAHQMGTSGT